MSAIDIVWLAKFVITVTIVNAVITVGLVGHGFSCKEISESSDTNGSNDINVFADFEIRI